MAVVFKLVRKPRTRKTTEMIKAEIDKSYNRMGRKIIRDFKAWFSEHGWRLVPVVTYKVSVSGRRYSITIAIDRRTKAGKVYFWVSDGTMDEGDPSTTYPIEATNVPHLKFVVPYQPLSMPPDGALYYDPLAEPKFIRKFNIDHPGIKPRHITQEVMLPYQNRKESKGFFRVTENAYKRGFRKAKKAGEVQ